MALGVLFAALILVLARYVSEPGPSNDVGRVRQEGSAAQPRNALPASIGSQRAADSADIARCREIFSRIEQFRLEKEAVLAGFREHSRILGILADRHDALAWQAKALLDKLTTADRNFYWNQEDAEKKLNEWEMRSLWPLKIPEEVLSEEKIGDKTLAGVMRDLIALPEFRKAIIDDLPREIDKTNLKTDSDPEEFMNSLKAMQSQLEAARTSSLAGYAGRTELGEYIAAKITSDHAHDVELWYKDIDSRKSVPRLNSLYEEMREAIKRLPANSPEAIEFASKLHLEISKND
jgi:hypothetical protein